MIIQADLTFTGFDIRAGKNFQVCPNQVCDTLPSQQTYTCTFPQRHMHKPEYLLKECTSDYKHFHKLTHYRVMCDLLKYEESMGNL